MRWAAGRSWTSLVIVPLLAAVLIVLAVLQYIWSGQVGEAERRRVQAILRESVSAFRDDYYRELLRVATAFQLETPPRSPREWTRYSERYAVWAQSSLTAGLVRSVFVWDVTGDRRGSLLEAGREVRSVQPVPIPAPLAPLIERLRLEVEGLRSASGRDVRLFSWTMDEDLPALYYPVLFPASSGQDGPDMPQLGGYVIVCLNQSYFRDVLFKELAGRHFHNAEGQYFRLAVVARGKPEQTIYRSDHSPGAVMSHADTRVTLLSPLLEGIPPVRPGDRRDVPPILPLNEGRWVLTVKHQAGSLEAVAGHTRRRNLAISFAVLLVLAAGMAIVIVSAHRARRLAALQVDFVAGVSHELRTPVAVICSAGENLADGVVQSPPQVARYGEAIRDEGRRLARMIEQILVFAGRRAIRPAEFRRVEIAPVVEQVLSECQPQIQQSGALVHTEVEASLPAVMADHAALKQCLENLVSNAVKYGGSAPRLAIRAREAMAGAARQVEIAVQDSGIGIEARDLPHIFEPFYRGRAAKDSQVRGFGLGLSLARDAAQAMGGRITVKSTPGQGSCFTLRLPAAQPEDAAQSSAG